MEGTSASSCQARLEGKVGPGEQADGLRLLAHFSGMTMDTSHRTRSSWRIWRWFWLALAIGHQCYHQYAFPRYGYDKVQQVAAARALGAGHGITLPKYNVADLATPKWEPLFGWPPGYSVAVAPFVHATATARLATWCVDWLATVLFFGAWFMMFERLAPYVPVLARWAFWMFWALAFPPLSAVTSSDALAVAIYTAGLATLVEALTGPKVRVAHGMLAGLCIGAAAAVRFAYWPLAAVPPVALACLGLRRERWRLAVAAACAGTAGLCLTGLAAYQTAATGAATYLTKFYPEQERGFFFGQLAAICPFPAGGVGVDSAWSRLVARMEWLEWASSVGAWSISALVLAACAWTAVLAWKAESPAAEQPPAARDADAWRLFWLLGLLSLAVTLGMLMWCTVRYPNVRGWAYVQESRYFAPVFGFFALGLAVAATQWRRSVPAAAVCLFVLLSCAGLAGTQRVRQWVRHFEGTYPPAENSARYDETGLRLESMIQNERAVGRTMLMIDNRIERYGVALMEGAVVIDLDEPYKLENPAFDFPCKTSREVVLWGPREDFYWSWLWRLPNDRFIPIDFPLAAPLDLVGPQQPLYGMSIFPEPGPARAAP